jgi:hypothetical protein
MCNFREIVFNMYAMGLVSLGCEFEAFILDSIDIKHLGLIHKFKFAFGDNYFETSTLDICCNLNNGTVCDINERLIICILAPQFYYCNDRFAF